jgi:uracil phosphoribosyltransferase
MIDQPRLRQLHVIDHPLVSHMLSEARDAQTPSRRFRRLLSSIGSLLAYEAMRDLRMDPVDIHTPMEKCQGSRLRLPVTIVPILRAGLGMADGVHEVIPEAHVGHIGMFRDEKNLLPVSYYLKLPARVAQGPVLLVDPMLATGGSAVAAVRILREHGCTDVRLICLIAAPEGVAALSSEYPNVPIYTASLDRQLNEKGYIMPGLGDAGDRLFGTTE